MRLRAICLAVAGAIGISSGLAGVAHGAPVIYDGTKYNTYQAISFTGTWTQANANVATRTYQGQPGTLATIRSANENTAARLALNGGNGWIGASDQAADNAWTWSDNGQVFFNQTPGGSGGAVVAGLYSNWNGGEPNGSTANDEDYAEMQSGGGWNDLNGTTTKTTYIAKFANTFDTAVHTNGHRYAVVYTTNAVTWSQARTLATTITAPAGYASGDLVSINDAAENAFVVAQAAGVPAWIGGNDAGAEGTWVWSDTNSPFFTQNAPTVNGGAGGTAVGGAFTNWNNGEPNGLQAGNDEDYAQLVATGLWNDLNGTTGLNGFVVEFVPEPSSLSLLAFGGLALLRRKRRQA